MTTPSPNGARLRAVARAIVGAVLVAHRSKDERGLRRALREAYPWGTRGTTWPYRVWCSEVRLARGQKSRPRTTPGHQLPLFG